MKQHDNLLQIIWQTHKLWFTGPSLRITVVLGTSKWLVGHVMFMNMLFQTVTTYTYKYTNYTHTCLPNMSLYPPLCLLLWVWILSIFQSSDWSITCSTLTREFTQTHFTVEYVSIVTSPWIYLINHFNVFLWWVQQCFGSVYKHFVL